MSRSNRVTKPVHGCGSGYCWCCDAKRCEQKTHDRWGIDDLMSGLEEREYVEAPEYCRGCDFCDPDMHEWRGWLEAQGAT